MGGGGGDGGGEGNSLISVWSQLLGRNILLLAGLNNIPPFRGVSCQGRISYIKQG